MARDARFHVTFADEASGESLGLMLAEGDAALGFQRRVFNPYAAKVGQGQTQDADLTEWSVWSQRDWRAGRGQENVEDDAAWFDSWNVETRIDGQLTLGPLPLGPEADICPAYTPGSVAGYGVGWVEPKRTLGPGTSSLVVIPFYGTTVAAQRFVVNGDYGFTHLLEAIKVRVKKVGTPPSALTVAIYSDGDDGKPDTLLTSATVAEADVGTSFAWETATLASEYSLSSDVQYWIVVSMSGGDDDNCYYWGIAGGEYSADSTWMGVFAIDAWFEVIGTFCYQLQFATLSRSQSFTTPAGGLTCSRVWLLLWGGGFKYGSAGLTAKLCADDGGDPGTVLQSKTVAPDTHFALGYHWVKVEWDSGQALSGSTVYHIVVEPPGAEWFWMMWGGNSSGGYGDGASKRKVGSGSWEAQTEDLYFRVNAPEVEDAPVAFARYNGKWYCAAGDTVYEWDETNQEWDVSEQVSGDDVTDLETWGGYLWAARGNDANLRYYNASSWADGGVKRTYLLGGKGYLHGSGAGTADHIVYYTSDGSTWATMGTCGAGDYGVTGMAWLRDTLVAATATTLFSLAVEGYAETTLDWSSQEDENNGKGMLTWMRTGALYIPLRFGLYRYNGDTMVAVGPEQGTGLPGERAGRVAVLVGTNNWLFAAIDAGTGGTSSVLAYNGMGGWHEIARAEESGQRILALGFETVHSPSRLWHGLDKETRYLQLPDTADNPYQWTGYEFNAAGSWESSWIGGDLLEVVKDLSEVVIRGDGFDSGQTVDVFYEVDRSERWTYLGRVSSGPRAELAVEASAFASKVVGSGSTRTTVEIGTGDTDDLQAGDWVRIKHTDGTEEVRQVATITDSDTFTLEAALDQAPSSGAMIYGSRPAGREFRFKLVLATDDNTATPRVTAVFCRYQANVLDRFVFQLQIPIVEGMKDLSGGVLEWTAADLRAELDRWVKRVTPFTMYDPDGNPWTVKVVSAGEGGVTMKKMEGGVTVYKSTYSMNLVEV